MQPRLVLFSCKINNKHHCNVKICNFVMYLSIFGVFALLFWKYFEKFPESPLLALTHPGRRAGRRVWGGWAAFTARTPRKYDRTNVNTSSTCTPWICFYYINLWLVFHIKKVNFVPIQYNAIPTCSSCSSPRRYCDVLPRSGCITSYFSKFIQLHEVEWIFIRCCPCVLLFWTYWLQWSYLHS